MKTRVVAVIVLLAAMFVTYDARPAAAACKPIDLSTDGSTWTVQPPASTTVSSATNVPAYPGWVAPPAGSSWISETNTTGTWTAPAGTWQYRLTFVVPTGAMLTPLTFMYAADNAVAFALDGVPIGGYPSSGPSDPTPFNQLHTLTTPPLTWLPGTHTLDAFVTNFSLVTGLLASGTLDLCTPQCSAAPILVRQSGTDIIAISQVAVQGIGSSSAQLATGTNTVGTVTVDYRDVYASCSTTSTPSATARAGIGWLRVTDGVNTVEVTAIDESVSATSTSFSYDCRTFEVVVNGSPTTACMSSSMFAPLLVFDEQIDVGTSHQGSAIHLNVGTIDVYVAYVYARS